MTILILDFETKQSDMNAGEREKESDHLLRFWCNFKEKKYKFKCFVSLKCRMCNTYIYFPPFTVPSVCSIYCSPTSVSHIFVIACVIYCQLMCVSPNVTCISPFLSLRPSWN